MLVECGFVRAQAGDGVEWTFTPSLGRIAALGTPHEIVALFGDLHDHAKAEDAARYVLASLCDQDDPTPLIGWHDADSLTIVRGAMPASEQILIARHLMQHGIVGKARPGGRGSEEGRYTDAFHAAEFIALARVHLGVTAADVAAMSMTELQGLLEMKFPEAFKGRDVPTREEYEAGMAAMRASLAAKEKRGG